MERQAVEVESRGKKEERQGTEDEGKAKEEGTPPWGRCARKKRCDKGVTVCGVFCLAEADDRRRINRLEHCVIPVKMRALLAPGSATVGRR